MESVQCKNCDLYFDAISSKDWPDYCDYNIKITNETVYPIANNNKSYYTHKRDWCFECLKKDDSLIKCRLCSKAMNTKTKVESTSFWILYKDPDINSNSKNGYSRFKYSYFRDRNHLGTIALKIIRYDDWRFVSICDKNISDGWYCLDCIESINHVTFPNNGYQHIYYNQLYMIEPLGYKFGDKDNMMQNGKSVMKVTNGIYRRKTNRKTDDLYNKRKKQNSDKGKIKMKNKELRYSD